MLPAPRTEDSVQQLGWARRLGSHGLSPLGRNFPGGGILVFDVNVCFVAAGGAGLADVGLSEEMLVGRHVTEAFEPAAARQLLPHFRRALCGEDSVVEVAQGGRRLCLRTTAVREGDTLLAGMAFVQDVTEARAHEQALHDSIEQFRLAFEHAPIGMAIVALDGTFVQVNPALCTLLGWSAAELLQRHFKEFTHPDDVEIDLQLIAALRRGERSNYRLDKRYCRPSGEIVWTVLSVALVRRADGSPMHFISQIQDVSERKRHELELKEVHSFQQAVLAASPDFIHVHDVSSKAAVWTSRVIGESGEVATQPDLPFAMASLADLLNGADVVRFAKAVDRASTGADGDVVEVRHQVRHRRGVPRWISTRLTPFRRDPQGAVQQLLGVSRDVTDSVALEEQLQRAALHDDLTGLPNRRQVNGRLEELSTAADRPGAPVLLFCDLDGFKQVNDAYGHQVGDFVLYESARRIMEIAREIRPLVDIVGRIGGDEFVLLLMSESREEAARLGVEVAERIVQAVRQPIRAGTTDHVVTASIGIATAQAEAAPDALLRDADAAMYQAKVSGKNGYAVFDSASGSALHTDACAQDAIRREIRAALAAETPIVHYQPVIDPSTGRVVEVEALLRIPAPDGGHLDAAAAVGVAEQTGLISALGERVMLQACRQIATWRRATGDPQLRVAINLSATEIARPGLFDRVNAIVETAGAQFDHIILEITETVLLDASPETVLDLRRLHDAGAGIAIDDFGTGYAGLRYLAELPVTQIKVDRSFTAALPDDAVSCTIVRATISLAAELNLSCVVEGVETLAQLRALPETAGLRIQGYLFAHPQAPGALPPEAEPGA
jgi:diguanylate cyclase (GGDEF)-like protein/PAS domain S-box-containing protein